MPPWCRTSDKRCLRRILYLVLSIAICGLVVCVSYFVRKSSASISKDPCKGMCSSRECVTSANYFLETMNQGTDPCEDSYSFPCGNFQSFLTEEDLMTNSFDMVELLFNMKDVIENIKYSADSLSSHVKTLYDSCMNAESSEFKTMSTLSDYMDRFGMSGWPHLKRNFKFGRKHDTFATYASYNDFFHSVTGENINPIFVFGPPTAPILYLFDAYTRYNEPLVLTPSSAGGRNGTLLKLVMGAGELMKETEDFEALVASLLFYLGGEASQTRTIFADYRKMENAMKEIESNFNGTKYITQDINCATEKLTLICETLKSFVEYNDLENFYSKTEVTVYNLPLLKEASKFLYDVSDRTLANYLGLRFILHNRFFMDSVAERLSLPYGNRPTSTFWFDRLFLSKWRRCASYPGFYLNPLISAEYIKQKIGRRMLKETRQIVDFYLGITSHFLQKQTWIEKSRRTKFSEFIQAVNDKLHSNRNLLLNSSGISVFYDGLNLSQDSFFQNLLELRRFYMKQNMIYPNFYQMGDFFLSENPFQKNAKSYGKNIGLEVQFGLLLPPFYEKRRPKLLNFATLGDVVAHEVGHEVNQIFCNILACEATIPFAKLDNMTMKNFKSRKQCLVNQYSKFDIRQLDIKNNGEKTFPENFADLVGLELTPKMIQMFLEEQGDSAIFSLPGLPYNFEQLIYISTSQFLCEKKNKDEMKVYETEVHSTPEIRLIGKAQNSKYFSEVFQCPEGSKMNPSHKCSFFENE